MLVNCLCVCEGPFPGSISLFLLPGPILFLMTAIDLACMGLPAFAIKDNGEKPKYLSTDAFKAIKQSQDEDKNVYWIYFKRRFVTYIIITLLYLLVKKLIQKLLEQLVIVVKIVLL